MTDFREHHRQNATKPACQQRRKAADRFRQSVEALVRSHRGFVTLGPDDTIAELAGQCGLIETDFCNFAIKQKGRETCLVFVPNRHWHHDGYMRRFRELKALAAMTGRTVALVPETLARRASRVGLLDDRVAELDLDVSADDRMTVISFLADRGSGKLSDLAALLKHPNPVSAVLRLATIGAVHVDLDATILPASQVNFPVAAH